MRSILTAFLLVPSCVYALTAAEWRSQSIYQVMVDRFARTDGSTNATCDLGDYCGGTWQGLINHLDYIQGMGFTAVWISPVVGNLPQVTDDGASYHGYWAQDIYNVNTNFGNASELVALSTELHDRGMYLMVDVVTNHMAYAGCGDCVDYSVFEPFNNQSYFHPYCAIDYDNATSIQECWEGDNIVALADLRTEDSNVLEIFQEWVAALVKNYTIDGLRIDSAQQVDQAFWEPFLSAADVYAVGEVFNGDPDYTCPYQEYIPGLLNYPAYYWITQAFQATNGSIDDLVNGINEMKTTCSDTTLLGTFLENHDNPRFPSYTPDISLAKNAIAFSMLADGIPILYQGQEQHLSGSSVPDNRETIWTTEYLETSTLYLLVKALNAGRLEAITMDKSYVTYQSTPIYSDSNTIAMRKGIMTSVYSNKGSSACNYSITLSSSGTGLNAGEQVIDILTCTSYKTDSLGNLVVTILTGLPLVLLPKAKLSGTSLCANAAATTSKSSASLSATMIKAATLSKKKKSTTTKKSTSIRKTISTTKMTSTRKKTKTKKSTKTSTTKLSPTSSSCTSDQDSAILFKELATVSSGQTVKLAGSIPQLGSWNTSLAVPMSGNNYTTADPMWFVTAFAAAGTVVEYKFIKEASDGTVTWEADPNHTYIVLSSATATVTSTWQT